MVVDDIFSIESLEDLQKCLHSAGGKRLRGALLREFWKVCRYTNAEEWNRAVRLCEALAIVGWGDCEPVEAYCSGDATKFHNRFDENRFVAADWSNRKAGVTMCPGRATYHASPDQPGKTADFPVEICSQKVTLASQRNWIPKNPIRLYQWLDNADSKTRKVVDSIRDQLYPALEKNMRPAEYGPAIDRIWIDYYFCSKDRSCPETYIVIDEEARLSTVQLYKRLLQMYPASQIKRENLFLRKRYDYGNFRPEKGEMKATIHFPKEFNGLTVADQKRDFAHHLSTVVAGVVKRLSERDIDYDLVKMQRDFEVILRKWVRARNQRM